MAGSSKTPRILIVTPEVTYLPKDMGNLANYFTAKAGGLADVSAALISALFEQGADVHVALPDYRAIFGDNIGPLWPLLTQEMNTFQSSMPEERVHLAEDRAFYYLNRVYSNYGGENIKIALAFQREVINNIVPHVRPDLIHCNDWMTGLIPAMARQLNIPCLFTLHNIHTVKSPLSHIEDRGIDAAYFWQHLYYENMACEYEETRESNPVDFLISGVFAAHFVNTVSPTFMTELVEGRHEFIERPLKQELANKWDAGCAAGILNAPDPSFNPVIDRAINFQYGPENHVEGKQNNKLFIQQVLGLIQDDRAPLFFWPSRLDMIQKGCQLLSEILYEVVSRYWDQKLEIVFVASGEFKRHFQDIVSYHHLYNRVAICDFDERLSRLAYGASDFVLMPSLFEPCGLPQMIGPIYGTLPVAHDTGGIHDTIVQMDVDNNRGNGFLFNIFDSGGLLWAIEQAMHFYKLPREIKELQTERIMNQSLATFNHALTAGRYIKLYEKMLLRPLINED
ncbi:MAG: glycogen/starch synthase [Deltaproteobacteria bacterium]|jgi:starch synthase/alpha-amylase|nr:glycogen/starch synthase [Deltaproteobacteria bacterium]